MKKAKSVLAIILALSMVFVLFACNKDDGATSPDGSASPSGSVSPSGSAGGEQSPSGGVDTSEYVAFTVGVDNYLGRFLAGINPAESWMGCDLIFDTILKLDMATNSVFSNVLTDWYYTDDTGTVLIMEMRDDVYFSNGENATAEDLVFSYTNHKDRGSNYLNNFGLILEECKPIDTYKAQFVFEKAYPAFERSGFYLIDKSWSEEVGWESMEWYNPVASGAYYVDEWVADSHMVLKLRDDYWNKDVGEFYVDEWTLRYYPDASTLYMSLETGEVDIAANISASDYGRFLNSGGDGYTCKLMQSGSVLYFCFGFQDLPGVWEDPKIREAIALSCEWDKLGQLAFGDMYKEALSIASTASPDYIETGKYEYNPERAKELFAELGYTASNKLVISTTMMESNMYKNVCEGFKFYMDQLGCVDATIEFADVSAALGVWLSPGGNDFGFWWSSGGSPGGDVRTALSEAGDPSGVTWDYVPFEDFLEIYERLANSVDPKVRSDAAKEIQQYMYDNIIYIPTSEFMFAVGWRTDAFSEQQILAYCKAGNNFQLSNLSLASSW